eukprot:1787525-Alexandrium_andersonii.AAC.1
MKSYPKQWKAIVARAFPAIGTEVTGDFPRRAGDHPRRGDLQQELATEDAPQCEECQRFFKSERAKAMHRVRVHGYASPVAQRIQIPWCPCYLSY